MAYCRTGEKPKSDVYCIQHINGEYCTMIASYRNGKELEHPDAGQIFYDKFLVHMRNRLLKYKHEGILWIPDCVFERINKELKNL